jgi:hypothetical protein
MLNKLNRCRHAAVVNSASSAMQARLAHPADISRSCCSFRLVLAASGPNPVCVLRMLASHLRRRVGRAVRRLPPPTHVVSTALSCPVDPPMAQPRAQSPRRRVASAGAPRLGAWVPVHLGAHPRDFPAVAYPHTAWGVDRGQPESAERHVRVDRGGSAAAVRRGTSGRAPTQRRRRRSAAAAATAAVRCPPSAR